MTPAPALAVVVVSYDSARYLPGLLSAVLGQLHDDDELVVVDNASHDLSGAVARDVDPRVRVIQQGANHGFAAGCHVGAQATQAPLLLFLNPDSRPLEGCLDRLRAAAAEHPRWAAWQAAVIMPDDTINTNGGVVHYLGMGWAGNCGQPLSLLSDIPHLASFPSGAAMVVRRETWTRLGGLDESYFLYGEDLDLGLRIWLAGDEIGVEPRARVVHNYEFGKGLDKWFWLERNRLRTVLSVYPAPLLLLLGPALIGVEFALLALAARHGWLSRKLRAQAAVLAGLPGTLRRRRLVQATRQLNAAEFASHLTASLDSTYLPAQSARSAMMLQRAYWLGVRRALRMFPG